MICAASSMQPWVGTCKVNDSVSFFYGSCTVQHTVACKMRATNISKHFPQILYDNLECLITPVKIIRDNLDSIFYIRDLHLLFSEAC